MGHEKKRDRLTIMSNLLPDDIYAILSSQAESRNLAQYIVNVMRENQKYQDISQHLLRIERKIDNLDSNNIQTSKSELFSKPEDSSFKEGQIINATKFSGGMEEEDKIEYDF